MPLRIRQPGQSPPLKVVPVQDFTGGLNLTSDRFNLEPNESPDMENVDVQRRGGVERRRSVQAFGTAQPFGSTTAPTRLWMFQDTSSPKVVAAGPSNQLAHCTGGAWTAVTNTVTVVDMTMMNGLAWFVAGSGTSRSWNGAAAATTAVTDAHGAYQNDYASAAGGIFPKAKVCESHNGFMWVGHTDEGGTVRESRVRFSHPGYADRWAVNDWIDVGEDDNDPIIRLESFRDHLLVVKRFSTWAIFGFSRESFSLVRISSEVGATNYHAVAHSPEGVWMFTSEHGLFLYDGESVRHAFGKIYPAMERGEFDDTALDSASVTHVRDRVWVQVPMLSGTRNTYVFDPQLGAWTRYPFGTLMGVQFFDSNGQLINVALTDQNEYTVRLEIDAAMDEFGHGQGDVAIVAYHSSPWMHGGSPFIPKRWKRPEFIVRGTSDQVMQVDVYLDYNDRDVRKTLLLEIAGPEANDDMVWDVDNWDEANWSELVETMDEIVRGGSIGGTGRAVQLIVRGPTDVQWELRAYALKFRPKNPRS